MKAGLHLRQECDKDLGVHFLALRFGHEHLHMRGLLDKAGVCVGALFDKRTSNAALSSCMMLDSCLFLYLLRRQSGGGEQGGREDITCIFAAFRQS